MGDVNIIQKSQNLNVYPVAATTLIEAGNLVAINTATGYAVEATDAAARICVGICDATADNSTGGAGDISVVVRSGESFELTGVALADADVGQYAGVHNSTTVELLSNTANDVVVGLITQVVSSTKAIVHIPVGGVNIPAAAVPDPLTIADLTVTNDITLHGDLIGAPGDGLNLTAGANNPTSITLGDSNGVANFAIKAADTTIRFGVTSSGVIYPGAGAKMRIPLGTGVGAPDSAKMVAAFGLGINGQCALYADTTPGKLYFCGYSDDCTAGWYAVEMTKGA